VETQPEFVVHHYTAAGLADRAVRYWRRAGRMAKPEVSASRSDWPFDKRARARRDSSRFHESYFGRTSAPRSADKSTDCSLGLHLPRLNAPVYVRASLCERLGDTPRQIFPVLGGLCFVYFNRGEIGRAHELAEQMMVLARSNGSREWLVWAHYALAASRMEWGDFLSARSHFEQVIERVQRISGIRAGAEYIRRVNEKQKGRLVRKDEFSCQHI
jgi:hypothetical protein